MADLLPHQQRVIDEKAELDDRLYKLNVFIRTDQCLGYRLMSVLCWRGRR